MTRSKGIWKKAFVLAVAGRLSLLGGKLRNFPDSHRCGVQSCPFNFLLSNAS